MPDAVQHFLFHLRKVVHVNANNEVLIDPLDSSLYTAHERNFVIMPLVRNHPVDRWTSVQLCVSIPA